MKQPANPTLSNGYEFLGWYLDSNFTMPATFPLGTIGQTLYAKFPNLPTDWLTLDGDHYVVTKGTNALPSNLVIPRYYDDLPVTHIADGDIGAALGGDCSSLVFGLQEDITSVELPNTMQYVGAGAFVGCTALTNVILPDSIQTINTGAFAMCMSLQTIKLPKNLTALMPMVFAECISLTYVDASYTNITTIGDSESGYSGPFVMSGDYGPSALLSIDLTGCSKLTTIGQAAFFGSGLTSITLPSSITVIDFVGFGNCYNLTQVKFEGTSQLTTIGGYVFQQCFALTSIDLSGCTNLTSIGDNAFCFCRGLTSVKLPSSLTNIGDGAFVECYALAEVYDLSTSLTIIAGSDDNGDVGYYAIVVHTSASEPSRIQTIDNIQYYVNGTDFIALAPTDRNLTSVTLDSRATAIKNHAFSVCSGLTSIDLSGCTGLTSIGSYAFDGCSGLTQITIPANVTKISRYVFSNCTNLTSITFEDTSTWYYGTSDNQNSMSGGTQISLTNAGTNATYFKSTYYDKYWYKV